MTTRDVNEVRRILNDIQRNKMKSAEIEFVKVKRGNYFVRVPKVTSQYLGFGKGKTKAYTDAILTLEEIERRWIA